MTSYGYKDCDYCRNFFFYNSRYLHTSWIHIEWIVCNNNLHLKNSLCHLIWVYTYTYLKLKKTILAPTIMNYFKFKEVEAFWMLFSSLPEQGSYFCSKDFRSCGTDQVGFRLSCLSLDFLTVNLRIWHKIKTLKD